MKTNTVNSVGETSKTSAGVGAQYVETASAGAIRSERDADWRLCGEGWRWHQAETLGGLNDGQDLDGGETGERRGDRDGGAEFGTEGWS